MWLLFFVNFKLFHLLLLLQYHFLILTNQSMRDILVELKLSLYLHQLSNHHTLYPLKCLVFLLHLIWVLLILRQYSLEYHSFPVTIFWVLFEFLENYLHYSFHSLIIQWDYPFHRVGFLNHQFLPISLFLFKLPCLFHVLCFQYRLRVI